MSCVKDSVKKSKAQEPGPTKISSADPEPKFMTYLSSLSKCSLISAIEQWKGEQEILETIMTVNFPKLISDTKPQMQVAKKTPSMINVPQSPQNPEETKTHLGIHFKTTENQR